MVVYHLSSLYSLLRMTVTIMIVMLVLLLCVLVLTCVVLWCCGVCSRVYWAGPYDGWGILNAFFAVHAFYIGRY
jgi:hypothetical protein